MDKAPVEAAIAALEGSLRAIDTWVLIFAGLVAFTLTMEVIFSVAHWLKERQLSPLRTQLSVINALELKDRDVRVANAEREASDAKIALETFKADRALDSGQQSSLIEKLKQFSGQQYVLSVSLDQESIRFARILDRIVKAAGWVKLATKGSVTIPDENGPGSFAGINVATEPGIRIQIAPIKNLADDPIFIRAGIVAEILRGDGIAAEAAAVPDMSDTPDAIQIRIGSKPK